MMTHPWGQYEKSVLRGPIDSLNQDPYRRAAADSDDVRTAHLGVSLLRGYPTLDIN